MRVIVGNCADLRLRELEIFVPTYTANEHRDNAERYLEDAAERELAIEVGRFV